jgi:hypothetical protein
MKLSPYPSASGMERLSSTKTLKDIERNLEDFDSDEDEGCEVRDKPGRRVRLKVKLLELKELSLAPSPEA